MQLHIHVTHTYTHSLDKNESHSQLFYYFERLGKLFNYPTARLINPDKN